MKCIDLNVENNVCTITLNRPDVFNSFNRQMALELQSALDDAGANPEVRCIVLTGTGKAFCAGQDLKEVTTPELHPGFRTILEEHYNPIIQRIRSIEKPVLAAVNGVAAGAGANIALACDIVLAAESASFIQAFSKIGLIPDSGGTFFLPRLVGFQRAMALCMLGDKVTAAEALQMGMIYKVLHDASFTTDVLKMAETLAGMPTKALGLTKRLINSSLTHNLDEQLQMEGVIQIEAAQTLDYKEGVQAFIEKRKPAFKGS
jgi:2-(1,2-epoxy-1,2-dihydrophenyl)acetyl-CoA isomerase